MSHRRARTRFHLLPAAAFLAGALGSAQAWGGDAICPPNMAYLDSVNMCIDRWEATVEVWSNDEGFVPHSPYELVDPLEGHLRAVSLPDVVPQGHVAGSSARAACFGASKTLCPMRVWRRACMGKSRWSFPYGPLREAGRCNDGHRDHPVMSLFPEAGNGPWAFPFMNDPRLNQQRDTIARTGAYPACCNEHGVFDLVGNLHEWIDDEEGTFLGGYYMDTSQHGAGCLYVTTGHSFRYFDYSTGFRCCAVPEGSPPSARAVPPRPVPLRAPLPGP